MKYLPNRVRLIVDNHFTKQPDLKKSSRVKYNDQLSTYYDAEKQRLHVHKNNRRKDGVQAMYFDHSNGIVRTLTSNPVKFYDLQRYATPRECADYHGFPQHFILPRTRHVNLFGNAISVPVAHHVLEILSAHGKANTMIDLCSGIGGFHFAAEQVFPGITCLGFSDIKKAAIECYQDNFPNVPALGDLRKACIPKADLLCSGFPCQPFSVSNRRIGEHKLIGMYKYVIAAIRASDAKYVVLENVVQLLKHEIFQEIKDTLVSMGYTFQHQVFNSKDFGLRQDRKRVYMYAWKRDKIIK